MTSDDRRSRREGWFVHRGHSAGPHLGGLPEGTAGRRHGPRYRQRAGLPAGRPLSTPPTEADQHEAAESTLRQAVIEALGDQADGVQLLVSAGTASSVLVQAARKFEADLVVLSRRPVHSPAWLVGEVSQHVLRNAPCPVLIVPETTS